MMTPSTFITAQLAQFAPFFKGDNMSYYEDEASRTHIIAIAPHDTYENDPAYIDWETKMTDAFIDLFETQNICFLTEDALDGLVLDKLVYSSADLCPGADGAEEGEGSREKGVGIREVGG